jgi:orotate phosphoribosyltransferase
MATPPGFEPRLKEPKSLVLPLHHGAMTASRSEGIDIPTRLPPQARPQLFSSRRAGGCATLARMADAKTALLQLLREKSVMFGEFTLASGARSDFYVDCRLTTMDANGAWLIGQVGWEMIQRFSAEKNVAVQAVGGLTMGADPVALAIAMASAKDGEGRPIHAFAVRKTPKAHGRTRLIEGNFAAGQSVAVVDDVITTGGSTLQAIDAVEKEGGHVAMVLALVDRQEGGRQAIEARGAPVLAIVTKEELRAVAPRSSADTPQPTR